MNKVVGFTKKHLPAAIAAAVGLTAVAANAADVVDTTEVVATIKGVLVPVAAVGGAVLSVYVGIKVWPWIKSVIR